MNDTAATGHLIDHLFRHQAGRIVARLTSLLGPAHLGLAEDAIQEALLRALQTWPHRGIPANPAAWLFRVAHNTAIDVVRRDRKFGEKSETIIAELKRAAEHGSSNADLDAQIRDDELHMVLMCCHPALSRDASVALSLKTISGFSVPEIARAFLCDDATVAQRIVRAKRLIRARRLTFELPEGAELTTRLDAVLDVIYFMFNEGYAAHDGARLIRQDLCLEALRLGRLVASASFATPRTHALVALIALQSARLPARLDDAGELVLLEDQDRSRWDNRLIALGFHHFDRSVTGDDLSEYHVQAAIAATYASAPEPEQIEWPLILQFYDQLVALNTSPVIRLNRAVALSKVHGPEAALAELEPLETDPKLQEYHLLLATRGLLLLEMGQTMEAADCFRAALDCVCSEPERRFLTRKLEACMAAMH